MRDSTDNRAMHAASDTAADALRDPLGPGTDDTLREALNRLVPVMSAEKDWPMVRDRATAALSAAGPSVATVATPPLRWRGTRRSRVVALAATAAAIVFLGVGISAGVFTAISRLQSGEEVIGGQTVTTPAPTTPGATRPTATNGGVEVGGGSWRQLSPLPSDTCGDYITALAMDPSDPEVLYAGTDSALYKSTDGGDSWRAVPRPEGVEPGVFRILIDQASPSTLYVVGALSSSGLVHSTGTVTKSTDGGATWEVLDDVGLGRPGSPSALTSGDVWLDPLTSALLVGNDPHWVGQGGALKRSTDGGSTWTELDPEGDLSGGIWSLLADPRDPSVLYAKVNWAREELAGELGLEDRLLRSADGGRTWQAMNGRFPGLAEGMGLGPSEFVVDPLDGSTVCLLVGPANLGYVFPPFADYGLSLARWHSTLGFVSSNHGETWSELSETALHDLQVRLWVAPETPPTAVRATRGFLEAFTGTLTEQASGTVAEPTTPFVVDPTDPRTLYVGTPYGVYRSTDGGATWTKASTGILTPRITGATVDPDDTSTIYATSADALYKSTDGGATWTEILEGVGTFLMAPSEHRILYYVIEADGGTKVMRSTDGAVTWKTVASPPAPGESELLAIDPTDALTLYAVNEATGVILLFKSTDGGGTWRTIGHADLPEHGGINRLVIDPTAPSTLYVGIGNTGGANGVFKSTDGGASWRPVRAEGWGPFGVDWIALGAGTPRPSTPSRALWTPSGCRRSS